MRKASRNDGLPHAELGEEILLPRQAVAVLQLPCDDPVAQDVCDHLREPGLMNLHKLSQASSTFL